ncbi:hypothetical protein ACQY0O_003801 [Thecaphora frezii]
MTHTHIVSFRYRPDVSASQRSTVLSRFLALGSTCLDAEGKRYILDISGGANDSPEGMGKEFDHTFILLFSSKAQLDYYLDRDPVHAEFKDLVKPLILDAFVFDFSSRWKAYDV